jgi:predicted ATP-grasp superfamily ATP-dependent carboligase
MKKCRDLKPPADAVVCTLGSGVNGLGIVRSLGRRGLNVAVVAPRANLAARSRYASEVHLVGGVDGKQLCDTLCAISARSAREPVLFIDNDAMLWALAPFADVLIRRFKVTSPLERISLLLDKDYQMQVAREAGLVVPRTWRPECWEDILAIEAERRRKLLAKPSPRAYPIDPPFKVVLADTGPDLVRRLKPRLESPKGLIVQEFVEGPDTNVWAVLGYASSGFCKSVMLTARKTLQSGEGAGGVMASGRTVLWPPVRELAARLIKALDYVGLFGVEFKYDATNDQHYFIELSSRAERFHTIAARAGFDLPWLAWQDLSCGARVEPLRKEPLDGVVWRDAQSCRHRLGLVGLVGNFVWAIRSVFAPVEWAVFSWDDLRPWVAHLHTELRRYAVGFARRAKRSVGLRPQASRPRGAEPAHAGEPWP